jgi:hypothetical protein
VGTKNRVTYTYSSRNGVARWLSVSIGTAALVLMGVPIVAAGYLIVLGPRL